MNQSINPETIRKRNSKNNETKEQKETRLARERELKRQKRAIETKEQKEKRLEGNRERRKQRKSTEITAERDQCRNQDNESQRAERETGERQQADSEQMNEQNNQNQNTYSRSSAINIDKNEIRMLKNFRKKMENIHYKICNVCNEKIPSLILVQEMMCRRCFSEKSVPKKFSAENNMDPGKVPDELKALTEIEQMLISQVFTVISVYRLRGGQTGYRGNVINFPQDVLGFTSRLPRNPSTLDVLVVRRQSPNDPNAFRDFAVRRSKVGRALIWLKENNNYYRDITIDQEILNSLPENGSIINMLPQIQDEQSEEEGEDVNDNEDKVVSRTFVPLLPPTN